MTRYYFSDRIITLPLDHPLLEKTRHIKKQFKRKMQNYIHEIKDGLLKEEHPVSNECERLHIPS